MKEPHRAFWSAEVLLQVRSPVSLVHQLSSRVIEEGGMGQDAVAVTGQGDSQVGFLSGWEPTKQH